MLVRRLNEVSEGELGMISSMQGERVASVPMNWIFQELHKAHESARLHAMAARVEGEGERRGSDADGRERREGPAHPPGTAPARR